jgi:glycosyltransferase involved in cell wall biosynthesis
VTGEPRPRLRILFLAPQPFFEVRGTPLAVRAMVRALTELGHHVELLTYPQGEDVSIAGLVHRRSMRLPVGRVRAGPSLAKLALDVPFTLEAVWRLATGHFDVVHAVEESAHLIAPAARCFKVAFVADVDSSIPDQLRYSGFATRGPLLAAAEWLERRALTAATATVTVCSTLTDGVRRTVPSARVFQIEDPPLVDPATPPDPRAVAALRRSWECADAPVALYSGNFEPYQGVELLVDAVARVPRTRAVFMGGEAELIAAMRGRARDRGVAERCLFVGPRPPSELPLYLAAVDLLVSPRCRGTNTPFKLYTYLASGKPLVATRIATHTQLLDDSLALLVEATPEALAAGMEAVLTDPAAAEKRARAGLELIESEYSTRRYREKVQQAYAYVQTAIRR